MTDKPALRAAARAERKRLADLDPQAASRAAEHAADLPPGLLVAVYHAIGSELDPTPLVHVLAQRMAVLSGRRQRR